MIRFISEKYGACQKLDLIIFLVRENRFMSWRVVLWVIIDVENLHMFIFLPTCLVLLQVKLHITIMFIMKIIYEGNFLIF